ncbi:O-antigen ligase family protein [Stieleria varia]|uniref:O-Antigen ligase n=1 Tax=Stieleria varia TaxID=2528005 RepID=A0A5C6AQK8_9BACT|nr:O-antigen ligase family protein [Stieleria varia]TWU01262.1 O-Antigen ligase [Stieleria varia]
MISTIVIYGIFVAICFAALIRPWTGVLGFYFFAVLDPGWNWRWAVDRYFPFQKYIFAFLVIGWLINGMPGLRYNRRDAAPIISLLCFLALAYASSSFSIDASLSSWYLDKLWKVVLVAIAAAITIDTPKKLVALLFTVVIAQSWNAYQINLQYFQDGYSLYARITQWGTKGDNNGYSILTLPVIAMSISLAASDFRTQWRLLALGIAVLQIHQIMLLESRGTMIGGLVMAVMFFVFMQKTGLNIAVVAMLLFAGFLLAGPSVVREFTSAFEDAGNRDSSAESRFHLWKAGWEITKDYPLLGVGPWCGALKVPEYYEGESLRVKRKELHNIFFELSTGTGLPATAFYLGFSALPWWACFMHWWRSRRMQNSIPNHADSVSINAVSLAVLCGLPGYFVASMFSSGVLLETSYILASCGCVASALFRRTNTNSEELLRSLGRDIPRVS